MCRIDRFLRNKNSREYFLVNRLSKDDSWNFSNIRWASLFSNSNNSKTFKSYHQELFCINKLD